MSNPWLQHVKQYRQSHPEISYKEALSEASKTYNKTTTIEGGSLVDKFKVKSIQKLKPQILKTNPAPWNTDFNMRQPLPKPKNIIDKKLNGYTRNVAEMIMKHQDTPITSITIGRTPLNSALQAVLNVASFGRAEQNKTNMDYDDYFHLFIIINNKFILEKNEVINFDKIKHLPSQKTETKSVVVPQGLTISDLLINTQNRQGNKFFRYSASSNNCQMFIRDIFLSNGIGTNEDLQFVKQDTNYIFNNSKHLRKFANVLTDTAAIGRKMF